MSGARIMLRIRKVQDDTTPANLAVIHEAQTIMRRQFPGIPESDIDKLPDQLRDPISTGFVSSLFVAEDAHDRLKGLALMLLFTDINVCYLELISAAPGGSGRGIGDVLYTRVQEEAAALGAEALFFECLPDEPALSPDPDIRAQNEARLKFYERFGARPIVGTAYETPIAPDATDPSDRDGSRADAWRSLRGRSTEATAGLVLSGPVGDVVVRALFAVGAVGPEVVAQAEL